MQRHRQGEVLYSMIDKKEFPIPVAIVDKAIIYTCLKPESSTYDGYLSEGGVDNPIKVYALYFHLNDGGIQTKLDEWRLIDTTEFHKQFWEMSSRAEKLDTETWIAMFSVRSEPISADILESVGIKSEDIYGKAQPEQVSAFGAAKSLKSVSIPATRARTAINER